MPQLQQSITPVICNHQCCQCWVCDAQMHCHLHSLNSVGYLGSLPVLILFLSPTQHSTYTQSTTPLSVVSWRVLSTCLTSAVPTTSSTPRAGVWPRLQGATSLWASTLWDPRLPARPALRRATRGTCPRAPLSPAFSPAPWKEAKSDFQVRKVM